MTTRATVREVAEAAGVSIATVSVALNGKPGVSEEMRTHIQEIAKHLNYVANSGARALKTLRTQNIGLIVPDIENPFFASVVQATNLIAEEFDYHVVLGVSNDNLIREEEITRSLVSNGIDGMLIAPGVYAKPGARVGHYDILHQFNLPLVHLTAYLPGYPVPAVMTDLELGEFELVRYLLKRGCKRIFLLMVDRDVVYSKMRIDGCRRAYASMGMQFPDEWIYETMPRLENGYQFVDEMLAHQPDAIVAINDFMAMGVLQALHERGVSVPDDISVGGFDDLRYGQLLAEPLTTISQPIEEICRSAVELLLQMVRTGTGMYEKKVKFLKPELIIRRTTI